MSSAAFVDDTIDFYSKGPSFAGSTITFKMAKILLDDFFSSIEAVRTGASTEAARLRFAHAEEMIPISAPMQLPGSEVQVPAAEDFSYANNPGGVSRSPRMQPTCSGTSSGMLPGRFW